MSLRSLVAVAHYVFIIYHLLPGFLSLCKEEPLSALSSQTPLSRYYLPRRTQVEDKVVSPSCFRRSLSSCPFSWYPLRHSFSQSVVFESCNMSRSSMCSLLDNVYDVIYTSLMSYPVLRLWSQCGMKCNPIGFSN